ncbi:hypothetical protein SAMN02927924_03622 [Sphingobium faniae]|nr:hypothetical protein SAMN02927924_03622 [Sphingobium faniae]
MAAPIMARSIQFAEKVQHFRGNILIDGALINRPQGVRDMLVAFGPGRVLVTRRRASAFHIPGSSGVRIDSNCLRCIPFRR